MAKDAPGMRGYRSRNEDGELRQKRGDTHVGTTIEKKGMRDMLGRYSVDAQNYVMNLQKA